MGGTIATLLANERPTFFNGVVLLAPGIIPDPRSAAPWQIEAAKYAHGATVKTTVSSM
jgi:pimeloyl-ACP methyl ester carboxylesterase